MKRQSGGPCSQPLCKDMTSNCPYQRHYQIDDQRSDRLLGHFVASRPLFRLQVADPDVKECLFINTATQCPGERATLVSLQVDNVFHLEMLANVHAGLLLVLP